MDMTINYGAHNICPVSTNNRACGKHNVARKRPYKYLLQVKITDDKYEELIAQIKEELKQRPRISISPGLFCF